MLTDAARPRVSRETRRLLAAVGLALVALWILARLRFPERPPSSNPVAPVLTQISPPTTFADLAEEVERVTQRIVPLLEEVTWPALGEPGKTTVFPAWPWREDLAIAIVPSAFAAPTRQEIMAFDRSTGVALIRITRPPASARVIWTPDRLNVPRYLFSAVAAPSRPAVVSTYVSGLEPQRSPAWSMEIWKVPAASGLARGSLVFTASGEWIGIATNENGDPVIVPAAALLDLAMRLSQRRDAPGGDLGIEVQGLNTSLAAATGANTGVVVARVDPRGAAANAVAIGDVIEAINGEDVSNAFAWQVHSTRLAAGAAAALRLRRGGQMHDVTLAVPPVPAALTGVLGLTLANDSGGGSRITHVAAQTAADRAGLQAGDIVTMAGEHAAPTPAQVRRAFDDISEGGAVLFAITRDTTHRLVVLTR